jgi:hypothetical protein
MDRVRYHCVLDSRVAFNVGEIARLVRAFQASDETKGLAMANFKEKNDIVTNKIPDIKHFYGTKFGSEKHTCDENCPNEATEDKTGGEPGKSETATAIATASSGGDGGKDSSKEKLKEEKDLVKPDDTGKASGDDASKATTEEGKDEEPSYLFGLKKKVKNFWPSGKKEN